MSRFCTYLIVIPVTSQHWQNERINGCCQAGLNRMEGLHCACIINSSTSGHMFSNGAGTY